MTIHQISIFLENKYGKLNEVLAPLGQAGIRIVAATVADTSEYGLLRIIVSDPQRALVVLKEQGTSANLNDVIAIRTDSTPGSFAKVISLFTQFGVSIEYMYCFSQPTHSILIIRTTNREAAFEVIRRNELDCVTDADLISM